MPEMRFTPGPWEATPPDGSYHDVIRIYAESKADIPIAICPQVNSAAVEVLCGSTNETTEAAGNACLIAAAPEMYEALATLLSFVNRTADAYWKPSYADAVKNADAALAKAVTP